MAEVEFHVTYEGPAVAEGQMPVSELAPALLALGELFNEASLVAYPDREPASLNIRATSQGSFVVDLAVHSPDAWEQIVQLFSGRAVSALTNLQAIVISATGGFLWLITRLRNRRIASRKRLESGQVRLVLVDGTTIDALREAVDLYDRLRARESAQRIVGPLGRPGIERVRFKTTDEPLVIEEDDLPAFALAEEEGDILLDREEERVVTLATASVEGKYKWRFSEGDRIITASMADPSFLAKIDEGEPFRKGDMFRVLMRVVQSDRNGKLHVERTVIRVLQHLPRLEQTQIDVPALDEPPPDDEPRALPPAE